MWYILLLWLPVYILPVRLHISCILLVWLYVLYSTYLVICVSPCTNIPISHSTWLTIRRPFYSYNHRSLTFHLSDHTLSLFYLSDYHFTSSSDTTFILLFYSRIDYVLRILSYAIRISNSKISKKFNSFSQSISNMFQNCYSVLSGERKIFRPTVYV